MGFAGLKVTHPCKQSVLPLLSGLSPDARALGAVNTVDFTAKVAAATVSATTPTGSPSPRPPLTRL